MVSCRLLLLLDRHRVYSCVCLRLNLRNKKKEIKKSLHYVHTYERAGIGLAPSCRLLLLGRHQVDFLHVSVAQQLTVAENALVLQVHRVDRKAGKVGGQDTPRRWRQPSWCREICINKSRVLVCVFSAFYDKSMNKEMSDEHGSHPQQPQFCR